LGTPEPEVKRKMRIIGLTGGIGSGKSTAAGFLADLGVVVVDLDRAGHQVLQQKEIRDRLVSEFGRDILDDNGEIDRLKLGRKVFSDKGALSKLNAIVHPAIDAIVEDKIREYGRQGAKVLVFEAAAMLEARRDWQVDEVWVITAPETAALQRLSGRPGYSEEDVKARLRSQITDEERIRKADVIIHNDGTLDELRDRVRTEWDKLQERLE
jgi:dephospho-CoA kinase